MPHLKYEHNITALCYAHVRREKKVRRKEMYVEVSDLKMPMIYTLSIASAIIFCVVMYLVINKILVKRLDKFTPAEILKNRE